MKLSHHSKIRLRERTNLNHKERRQMFRTALQNGLSPDKVEDKKIRDYMNSKNRHCKVKLYKGYIFLYSKNSHQLYTMYELPNEVVENK